MLYKEVVVNNFASFFLGVDDPVREHHQGCTDHPITQTRLCHLVKKKDGKPYNCPRHENKDQSDSQTRPSTSSSTRFGFPSYHKQELLAMVEAIHVVYASSDKYVYSGLDIDSSGPSWDDHNSSLSDLCDIRRYTDYPACVKGRSSKDTPLVNLKRATVGRWMSDYWDSPSFGRLIWQNDCDDSDSTIGLGGFEHDLADDYPHLHPRFICRHSSSGPLDRYPSTQGKIEINTLHHPRLDNCWDNLVVGALNLVHIGPHNSHDMMGAISFMTSASDIASSISQTFKDWDDRHGAQIVKQTFVRFTICRDTQALSDGRISKQICGPLLDTITSSFRMILGVTSGPTRDLRSNWDICWADEEGDCPACQPDTCHLAYRTDSICNKNTRSIYEKTTKEEA